MAATTKTTLLTVLAGVLSLASAAPATTTTGNNLPSRTLFQTGVTHTVVAGRGGALVFDPENVVAEVGDVIEWHFLPRNHSVAQSSFGEPCVPLKGDQPVGFFSGFQPVEADAAGQQQQAPNVFQVVVPQTETPIWYYCAQTVGDHCQKGMAGVINQDFDSANTLAVYKENAKGTGVSVVPAGGVSPPGSVIPNPNPQGGF